MIWDVTERLSNVRYVLLPRQYGTGRTIDCRSESLVVKNATGADATLFYQGAGKELSSSFDELALELKSLPADPQIRRRFRSRSR